jgi:hypothetical protein
MRSLFRPRWIPCRLVARASRAVCIDEAITRAPKRSAPSAGPLEEIRLCRHIDDIGVNSSAVTIGDVCDTGHEPSNQAEQ